MGWILTDLCLHTSTLTRTRSFSREIVQPIVANWPLCGLRLLPQTVEPFNYGLAFGPDTPRAVVDAFSTSILLNKEDRTIQV